MENEQSRTESDLLGELRLPAGALHGIHTERARASFPLAQRPVHPSLVRAYGAVKLACARTNHELGSWNGEQMAAIEQACRELMDGQLTEHVLVDALQGGAGTSTNMNVNEVLTNRALQLLGLPPGSYEVLHPLEDLNLHQSTNDTYPTALRVAAIGGLRELEQALVGLVEALQRKEQQFSHVVKVGRTQLQDAVLTTVGREIAAWAEAFGRDRWRVYKCEERLRVVNLGGTAIGTGLLAPRRYIFRVTERLRELTGYGLARAENLVEATQNADAFVEVSGMLKTCATNLLKVAGDLRLLSSGPDAGLGELRLPPRQAGSTIMPGKVNPVIPEAVTQAALSVLGHDVVISQAAAMGSLELNPFLPLVADALLGSLDLLKRGCTLLAEQCVEGLQVDEQRCRQTAQSATSAITALVEQLGYRGAQAVAEEAAASGRPLRQVVLQRGLLSEQELDELLTAEQVTRLGGAGKIER